MYNANSIRLVSKKGMHSLLAFSVSACVHLAVCLSLALVLISGQGTGSQSSTFDVVSNDDSEVLTQLDINRDVQALVPVEPMDPTYELAALTTSSVVPPGSVVSLKGSGNPLGKVADQVAEGTGEGGGSEESIDKKSKSRASFFGAQADGNRFVFVIDSSGSMRGPRWEALCKELIRAIQTLSPDQDFFIISFDSLAHPMFGTAPPKGKFLKPTAKNVDRVKNWLRSITHGSRTFPASAVGIAMKLEPDAIFLLSDGEISDSTVEDLRIWNRTIGDDGYPKSLVSIHTVLLHSRIGYVTLETIARENSGTFTPVQPR